MRTEDTRTLAESLLAEHLPDTGWTFTFDNAKGRLGLCSHRKQQISVSRPVSLLNDEGVIRNTILHEIAHAIVGAQHGHDATWRAEARRIGCDGATRSHAVSPEATFTGLCPSGHRHPRNRRPRNRVSCTYCTPRTFDSNALITWHRTASLATEGTPS